MKNVTEEELLHLLAEIEKANREKQQDEMEEARAWNQG